MKQYIKNLVLPIILLMFICFACGACTSEAEESNAGFSSSVDSYRLVKDQDDNNIIIIKYNFSNDECDKARSFSEIVTHRAKQDDIKLSEVSILPDDALFSTDAQTKKLKKANPSK